MVVVVGGDVIQAPIGHDQNIYVCHVLQTRPNNMVQAAHGPEIGNWSVTKHLATPFPQTLGPCAPAVPAWISLYLVVLPHPLCLGGFLLVPLISCDLGTIETEHQT